MGDGEEELLSHLSLFSLSPGVSNLWIMGTVCPSPCLCCHDLCDAVRDVGCRSLCSTCCTSLHTPSPTVDTSLFPSAHGLQDLDPSVHMALTPEVVAFVHQGCGSCSHQGSETASSTCRVLLLLLPPRLLPCIREESVVSRSAGIRKTLIESGTLSVNVRSCVHYV